MKRTTLWIWAAVALLVLPFPSCKKAEVETATLKIILSAGVTGVPTAGDYEVKIGEEQSYSYSLEAGFNSLTVTLDGKPIESSGSFVVSGDHVLQAYSEGNVKYLLKVTRAEGVNGTPETGAYYYTSGAEVPYNYALADGYVGLDIKLDDVAADPSGSISMTKDRMLIALAEKAYNVLGRWEIEEIYGDGSDFKVTAEFSGELNQGTVTDSEGGSGSFKVDGAEIEFNLKFPDVTYEYSGDFFDETNMEGTCKRYQSSENEVTGEWTAKRVAESASSSGGAQGKARKPK